MVVTYSLHLHYKTLGRVDDNKSLVAPDLDYLQNTIDESEGKLT